MPGAADLAQLVTNSVSPSLVVPGVLPGTYYVRVTGYYGYEGEYRLRVSKVTAPTQIESEPDDGSSHPGRWLQRIDEGSYRSPGADTQPEL